MEGIVWRECAEWEGVVMVSGRCWRLVAAVAVGRLSGSWRS